MTHARLLAAVVLPSEGVALVNNMNFGGCPAVDSSKDVCSERKASVNCDLGCVRTLMLRCAVDIAAVCSALDRFDFGMTASDGRLIIPSISWMLCNPVSR